jgi:release factor glutamine methyltransferase
MSEVALPLAQKAAQLFGERGFENARLEAELLLAHVLGIKRLDLYLQFDRPLTQQQLETFRALVRRRLKREPLQYIVGTVQFRELTLHVDRRVLIPRPETEVLVGQAISWAAKRGGARNALDIGTGSGAIALSLVHEKAVQTVVATDVSPDALTLAQANAERLGLANSVDFRCGSLWAAVENGEMFDIVISNPPYVAWVERETLQPEVREWEPPAALFAESDGLSLVRDIIHNADRHLNPDGLLALEVGMTQAALVADEIRALMTFGDINVIRDLAGRDRVVTAVRKADG